MGVQAGIAFACQTYSWQMSGERYRGRLEHIAHVAADAGFPALEPEVYMLGEYLDPGRLHDVLDRNKIELAALAFAGHWLNDSETDGERRAADEVIATLSSFPQAKLVLVQLPGVDRADLALRQARAIACMNAVARRALEAGLHPTVHPNSPPGSVFRLFEDYELLLERLDPAVGFTPDLGHIAAGGMDPLETVTRYRDRVDHIHFKDIDADGTWAATGRGRIDFPAVVSYLSETKYEGWVVFEDECAESKRDPDGATRRNAVYAHDTLAPLLEQVGHVA